MSVLAEAAEVTVRIPSIEDPQGAAAHLLKTGSAPKEDAPCGAPINRPSIDSQ